MTYSHLVLASLPPACFSESFALLIDAYSYLHGERPAVECRIQQIKFLQMLFKV